MRKKLVKKKTTNYVMKKHQGKVNFGIGREGLNCKHSTSTSFRYCNNN